MHEIPPTVSHYRETVDCRSPISMRTSPGEERTSQRQSSGCMTSAVAFSEDGLTLTQDSLQSLVVQTTRRVAVRSLFSPEDAASERSCFPVFSISEDPSASAQVTKKIRGHGGSPPHVLSCQGKDDAMVSWSLTDHWMQKTHQLLPRLRCLSLTCRRRLCVCYHLFATSNC